MKTYAGGRNSENIEAQQERAEEDGTGLAAGIMSLNGMVALVTGGAQGIGRAVVHSLIQSSVKVSTFRSFLL